MNWKTAAMVTATFLGACADHQKDVFVAAFQDLEEDILEIRLGDMPGLGAAQCNRNMYAGLRSERDDKISVNLSVMVSIEGARQATFERELELAPTSQSDLIAGQVVLFPQPFQISCSEIDVNVLSMQCLDGSHTEEQACPKNIRWQWLQGFKMFEIPKTR